ncbi:MAG: STAS domain-containing protein [Chromatiaceae bacterium]|nr:STAS domain-containing protein [Gammaproteobacteria bacterium]MCP5422952.1 STAS domain-containing protein [Chromatiaceae bacterium]
MSQAALREADGGRWRLSGVLDFASVPVVWPDLQRALSGQRSLTLTLDGVERSNSAGLVLLVEAIDAARTAGCALELADIPDELLDLARMSNCVDLLGAGDAVS